MDQVSYDAFKRKLDQTIIQNKQLVRANLNMKREVKELRRVVKRLKDAREKEHKKRGSELR